MTLRHIVGISGETDIAELAHSTKSPFFGPSSWVLQSFLVPSTVLRIINFKSILNYE